MNCQRALSRRVSHCQNDRWRHGRRKQGAHRRWGQGSGAVPPEPPTGPSQTQHTGGGATRGSGGATPRARA